MRSHEFLSPFSQAAGRSSNGREEKTTVIAQCFSGGGWSDRRNNRFYRLCGSRHLLDALQEIFRGQRLYSELNLKTGILLSCFLEATDHQDWHLGLQSTNLPYEAASAHAGHDVVRDNEVDFREKITAAKLLKSASGVQNCGDRVSIPFQDGLTYCGLDCIVIHQKDRFGMHLQQLRGRKLGRGTLGTMLLPFGIKI
jgi:hypothetical protein